MSDNWCINEIQFNPYKLRSQESIFTIGNGSFCTRGSFEESYPGDIPVTLASGLFDDVPTYHSELVNLPNWLDIQIWVDGELFRMDRGSLLSYRRTLNLYSGCLLRQVLWRSSNFHTFKLQWERWISLADPHAMGIRLLVHSLDYSGEVEVRAGLDGLVDNAGFRHWDLLSQGRVAASGEFLHLRTRNTHIEICQAFSLSAHPTETFQLEQEDRTWAPRVCAKLKMDPGHEVVIDKLVSTFTGQNDGEPGSEKQPDVDLIADTISHLNRLEQQGFDQLGQASAAAWAREWDDCAITIDGDPQAERRVRFSLYQLLIAAPHHRAQGTIGARGLSGFGYHGHIFWDAEFYMLPFFIFSRPELARRMLLYRYYTLSGARSKAREKGWKGAMFAWESALTGEETTPRWVPVPNGVELERIWSGELALFITAGVAWGVNQYWQVTGDDSFIEKYGAEIVLDTACFWESRVEWNPHLSRFDLTNVIGPDEFHTFVNNNAFTNYLVRHNLEIAGKIWSWLIQNAPEKASELKILFEISSERLQAWENISQNIAFPIDPLTGLIEQFEGYFQLGEICLADYEPRLQSIQVILGLRKSQQVKITRQPDGLLLLYLFKGILSKESVRSNWEYYAPRTDLTHGSSLGYSIHASLAAQLGEVETAHHLFRAALAIDLDDTFKNTKKGIHTGNAGGIWQAIVFGFAGLEISDGETFSLHPCLPPHWKRLTFSIYNRGKRQTIEILNSDPTVDPMADHFIDRGVADLSESDPIIPQQSDTEILIDSLPGMTYRGFNNSSRTMLEVDPYCYNLTGFHPAGLIRSQPYGDLIHPNDREYVLKELEHALYERRSYSLIYRIITATEKEKWVWEKGHFLLPIETAKPNILEGRILELTGRNTEYAALSEYAERLENLREIDQAILAARSSVDVIQIALRALRRLVPVIRLSLLLFNLQEGRVELFCITDRSLEISREFFPITLELRRWWNLIISRFDPDRLFTHEDLRESCFDPVMEQIACNFGPYNQLVELESQGTILGVLILGSETSDVLPQSLLGTAHEIAGSLSIAITQRRLLEQLHTANQNLQNLSRRLVDLQEQERRSLARELHDEIGQALTAVKINLEGMTKMPAFTGQRRLEDSIEVVHQTLQQVRNLSLDLRPAMLDELGLVSTLRWYLDRLSQWNNIESQFRATLRQERLPSEIETTLFRVAQEALTNTVRHSDAKRVIVLLSQAHGSILLQIRDNGRGFQVSEAVQAARQGKSMGLLSIQERLHLIGGKLEIHSMPGMGSEILAQVPYSTDVENPGEG